MPWVVVLSVVAAAGFLSWQYWRWTHRRMLEFSAKVPGPPALPILGNALMFMINPGQFLNKLETMHKTYGQYVRFWLGPELNLCMTNPTDIREVLSSTKVNEKGPTYECFVPFIGYGIIAGGKVWRKHRKIATPSYNKKSVEYFTPVINVEAEQLARILSHKEPNVSFNVFEDVVKCTTRCVNQTLLGFSREDCENLHMMDKVLECTPSMYALVFAKMTKWWLQIPLFYWLSGKKRLQDTYTKIIDEFATDILRRRREALEVSIPEFMGPIDRFILSGELSEEELKLETMTVFTTSQEPSAKIASALLMVLAHLPDWQDKVYKEIMEVVGAYGPVTREDLNKLHNLESVYKEVLRYFSIAPLIQRTVMEEITINEGKYSIPAGTSLTVQLHLMHRDPRNYDEPNKIKPERFLPENEKNRDPNSFMPFSTGPMDCIGRIYAQVIVKSIVVWVLRYARLEPAICLDNIKLNVAVSTYVDGGYTIKVKPRQNGRKLT